LVVHAAHPSAREAEEMRARIRTVLVTLPLLAAVPVFAGWDEGVAAFTAKNYAEAARQFEGIVRSRSDWAGGYLMLGRTQLLLKRTNDAVTTLRQAYDLKPEDLEIQLALAQAYLAARRPSESLQLLSKINAAGVPKERQLLYQQLQAKAAADSGQTAQASSALARAAATSPNNAGVQFNYGVFALNAGDTATAVTALEKAVRLAPNDAEKKKVLIQALVKQGRETRGSGKDAIYTKAATAARALVSISATFDNLLLLGETQLGAGQYDAAVATFGQASGKNGGEWLPYFYAGQAQTATAKYGPAEVSLRRALDRANSGSDKSRIHRQLGFVYEKQRSFAQAKASYRSAGDQASVTRVEENEDIAAHNRQADEEAARLVELRAQQERLREQLQESGAPPPR
jgi:tetratricopeptide (TPR) repeat protein